MVISPSMIFFSHPKSSGFSEVSPSSSNVRRLQSQGSASLGDFWGSPKRWFQPVSRSNGPWCGGVPPFWCRAQNSWQRLEAAVSAPSKPEVVNDSVAMPTRGRCHWEFAEGHTLDARKMTHPRKPTPKQVLNYVVDCEIYQYEVHMAHMSIWGTSLPALTGEAQSFKPTPDLPQVNKCYVYIYIWLNDTIVWSCSEVASHQE